VANLLIKNDGLGDLILASGLISDLAVALAPLELITCASNREIAEAIPGLAAIHYISRDSLKYQRHLLRLGIRWDRATAADKELLRSLGSRQFQTAICLRRFIRQSSLRLMASVNARHKFCAWQFPTNCPPDFAQGLTVGWQSWQGPMALRSELEYGRAFIQAALGVECRSAPRLSFAKPPSTSPSPDVIGLAIGGSSTNWPDRSWESLAQGLVERGHRIVLFGGPDATRLADRIASRTPVAANHVGRLSFAQAVQPLNSLALLIGNDTGFTHFATLCTRQLLVILGGGTFYRFFPWPEASNQHIIYHGMDCFDCDWKCRFRSRRCLDAVSPAAVIAFADQILAGNGRPEHNLNPVPVTYRLAWRRCPDSTATVACAR